MSVREVSPIIIGGAQEGELKAVASGALPNGKTVIVNSNGTVSVVGTSAVSQSVGSPTVFETASSSGQDGIRVVYDSNAQKIVIVYRDNGNESRGTAIVGTVSGTSISFGSATAFQVVNSFCSYIAAAYDSNAQKIVIAYNDFNQSQKGFAIVGTVSGTSISFGSEAEFEAGTTSFIDVVYDSNSQKHVIVFSDGGDSERGKAIVATVSGNSISYGSTVTFDNSSTISYINAVYDSSAQKVVISYRDGGNNARGTAIVGTVSGTSISFGSSAVWDSSNNTGLFNDIAYDSNANRVVISYRDTGNSNYGTAVVGEVSGTSISFGTSVVFESAHSDDTGIVYDSNAKKVVIAYKDTGDSGEGRLVVGTVDASDNSISFGSATEFESGSTNDIGVGYDSDQKKVVIAYQDDDNSDYGTAVVFSTAHDATNLTLENYIGISSGGSVADTENATVDIIGSINEDQSSLTAGQQYFVQNDGTLNTTADDPSVLAGTAISATQLLVKT